MKWERVLKNLANPILIPRIPLETLRDNLSEPIPESAFEDREFMSRIMAGVQITLTLADYYDIPHRFDRNNPQDVFSYSEIFDEGPLVLQEDKYMIHEELDDIYYKVSKKQLGFSARNKELSTFTRLDNKDWDEFARD